MASDPRRLLTTARAAALPMAALTTPQKNQALEVFATAVTASADQLLSANAKDLKAAAGEINAQMLRRLEFDRAKLDAVVDMIHGVSALEDPSQQVLKKLELDTGLTMVQKTVPLGVVVVVFESRPDVIPQISALALKSGNAVVLKGGREARHTNQAFGEIWRRVGRELSFLPRGWLQQVHGREEFRSLLKHHDLIDLVIPRGSNQLVTSVMKSTQAPVLGHADGICAMFVHESADLELALKLVVDAKLQAPSTCNAIETLLVQQPVAAEFFKRFEQLSPGIRVLACPKTRKFLKRARRASDRDFETEFGDERLAVKIVADTAAAIAHINRHGSHHTDAIVAEEAAACADFCNQVDSATVVVNASTRFNDGYRLGLGAEVGVSTSKIHARGPAGLDSLVTTKFIVEGSGQVVSDYVGLNAKPFKHRRL